MTCSTLSKQERTAPAGARHGVGRVRRPADAPRQQSKQALDTKHSRARRHTRQGAPPAIGHEAPGSSGSIRATLTHQQLAEAVGGGTDGAGRGREAVQRHGALKHDRGGRALQPRGRGRGDEGGGEEAGWGVGGGQALWRGVGHIEIKGWEVARAAVPSGGLGGHRMHACMHAPAAAPKWPC